MGLASCQEEQAGQSLTLGSVDGKGDRPADETIQLNQDRHLGSKVSRGKGPNATATGGHFHGWAKPSQAQAYPKDFP